MGLVIYRVKYKRERGRVVFDFFVYLIYLGGCFVFFVVIFVK